MGIECVYSKSESSNRGMFVQSDIEGRQPGRCLRGDIGDNKTRERERKKNYGKETQMYLIVLFIEPRQHQPQATLEKVASLIFDCRQLAPNALYRTPIKSSQCNGSSTSFEIPSN